MKKNVTISIDDIHPEKEWGCEGDQSVEYLQELNNEFGCKFTLFIPSNYHNKYPISKHVDWINFWKEKDWVELAAHGHYHACERADMGECEFFELDTQEKTKNRIEQCISEWKAVEYIPRGWRNPGWLAHPEAIKVLGKHFDYVALHDEHNHNIQWNCKMIFGHDGINEIESIKTYNDTFMFQSHIAGDWNDNVWNDDNYENFKSIIIYLSENYSLQFKTLGEL